MKSLNLPVVLFMIGILWSIGMCTAGAMIQHSWFFAVASPVFGGMMGIVIGARIMRPY